MWKAMRSKNTCKTCALGMGGQLGGMRNEEGRFLEVCKKSVQAMASDMQGAIREGFFTKFSIDQLKLFSPRELEQSGRLTHPLFAGVSDTHYKNISWEEALDRIADKIKSTSPEDTFFYSSGRSSNEAGFLLHLFARLYGTNNINTCQFYCHQASGVGLSSVTGSGTATVVLDDIEEADLLILIGGNPASNHPRFMTIVNRMKSRGGKMVVVNPVKETGLVRFKIPSNPISLLFGTKIADEYVQPSIGGDIAFLFGLAKYVLEKGAVDKEFVKAYTEGWEDFKKSLENLSWDEILKCSGVEKATIEKVADMYIRSDKTIFCWAMGITHHQHGVQNVQMIANLAMMRGMLGKPHVGLLPLRGHSNVQGIGSIGAVPILKEKVFERLQNHFGVKLPTANGLDTLGCILRADEGRIHFAFCLGGNLYGSNPDSEFSARALNKIDMIVYLNTTLNTGHAHGRGEEVLILPVLARDEEKQPTTQESMFNYVRLSDGGPARHVGLKSEVEVIAAIARKVLGNSQGVDWQSMEQHGRIREAIAAIIPGYEKIGEIDKTKKEFQISGRTFHEPKFNTFSGKAIFHSFDLPTMKTLGDRELRLMTVRSEGQFNTVVYEEEDLYRGQERRDVILMNNTDIQRMGLKVDQRVTVRSEAGAIANVLVREYEIHLGNALMYYPEANAIVLRIADQSSHTPSFKSTYITVEA